MDCKSTHFFGKYTTTLKKSDFQSYCPMAVSTWLLAFGLGWSGFQNSPGYTSPLLPTCRALKFTKESLHLQTSRWQTTLVYLIFLLPKTAFTGPRIRLSNLISSVTISAFPFSSCLNSNFFPKVVVNPQGSCISTS